MLNFLAILLAAAAPSPAVDFTGVWDLSAEGQAMMRLDVEGVPSSPTATLEEPRHYQIDADTISQISGPTIVRHAFKIRRVNGDMELKFENPTPDATADILLVHKIDRNHADIRFADSTLSPLSFARSATRASTLGPWDGEHTYVLSVFRPTNSEMTSIFEADQADRQTEKIDWTVVRPADERRRARTQALLDAGALHSGDDYSNAAFVFQHGDAPADYLKAHLWQ